MTPGRLALCLAQFLSSLPVALPATIPSQPHLRDPALILLIVDNVASFSRAAPCTLGPKVVDGEVECVCVWFAVLF